MHWIFCLFEKGNRVWDFFQRTLVVFEPQRKGHICVIRSERRSRFTLWMNMALTRIVLYLHFLISVSRQILYDLPSWIRKEQDVSFGLVFFFLVNVSKIVWKGLQSKRYSKINGRRIANKDDYLKVILWN